MLNPMLTLAAALLVAVPMTTAIAQSVPLSAPAPVAAPADAAKAEAPAPQKTAEQLSADRQNEIVCKREREIASLVKTRKTCHTRAQWAYIHAETSRQGQDFISANRAQSSGSN